MALSDLASQAVAAALLEKWGGSGVQKDAFLKKRFGSLIGTGVKSIIGKTVGGAESYFANQAAGNATKGFGRTAIATARSLSGVAPGQAAFAKPLDYITRPLRSTLFPNLGKPLNVVGMGAAGTFAAQKGHEIYSELGKGADKIKQIGVDARISGAPVEVLKNIENYSTRGGLLSGWLRNHGVPDGLLGQRLTDGQKKIDSLMSDQADDMIFGRLRNSMGSSVAPYEVFSPIRSLLMRGVGSSIGEAHKPNPLSNWQDQTLGEASDQVRGYLPDLKGVAKKWDAKPLVARLGDDSTGLGKFRKSVVDRGLAAADSVEAGSIDALDTLKSMDPSEWRGKTLGELRKMWNDRDTPNTPTKPGSLHRFVNSLDSKSRVAGKLREAVESPTERSRIASGIAHQMTDDSYLGKLRRRLMTRGIASQVGDSSIPNAQEWEDRIIQGGERGDQLRQGMGDVWNTSQTAPMNLPIALRRAGERLNDKRVAPPKSGHPDTQKGN